jgi:superfamily II DNA or RNA helicase
MGRISMSDFQLYPHQVGMVERHKVLLQKRGVTSDRSETGVGKTPAILQAAKELQVPFAVICPKTLISHWTRWCRLMELKPVAILGWEGAKIGKSPRLFNPKNPGLKWLAEWPDRKVLLIFDEAHRAKSKKSQNSKMVASAAAEGHWLALLSATLIQNPLDLLGLGYPLKLVAKPYYAFKYAQAFGVGIGPWGGYEDFSSQRQKLELYQELDKVGLRIRKAEICPTMCVHRADLIDSEKAATVRGIYEDLEREIAELAAKKNSAMEEITKRLRARQAAELAKVPIFIEEALRHLEEGARVALFFCFQASIDAATVMLKDELGEVPGLFGVITGATSLKARDEAIEAFNFGDSKVLVLNIAAGGEGISLHDQDGRFPRVGLLSIPESSTHLIQALGRNDRVGAKSVGLNRILFCAGTMEERVYENLSGKIRDIETINDGDLSVLSEVMK